MPSSRHPEPIDLAVVGAGAAGLFAAAVLLRRRPASSVLLLDRLPSPGAKLAVTGGGRGNLSRLLSPEEFAAAFGTRFVLPAFRSFPPGDLRAFFASLSLPLAPDPSGALYPVGQSAPAVRDALLGDVLARGARLRLASPVRSIRPPSPDDPFWLLDGSLRARTLLLAAGGRSAPALGSDGSGFALAAALGHAIVPPVPALAPLPVLEPWARSIPGVSLPDVRLSVPGSRAASRGPLLFTHRGISGPAALDISAAVNRRLLEAPSAPAPLRLRLLPAPPDFPALRASSGARPLLAWLSGSLPRALARALLALAALPEDLPLARLSAPAARTLSGLLADAPLSVPASAPFAEAMLTAGGVALSEVSPKTLRSRLHPTLAFAGEILDVQGPTGGYNLHFAFASARLAALNLPLD